MTPVTTSGRSNNDLNNDLKHQVVIDMPDVLKNAENNDLTT
jgi:hypothetical protein